MTLKSFFNEYVMSSCTKSVSYFFKFVNAQTLLRSSLTGQEMHWRIMFIMLYLCVHTDIIKIWPDKVVKVKNFPPFLHSRPFLYWWFGIRPANLAGVTRRTAAQSSSYLLQKHPTIACKVIRLLISFFCQFIWFGRECYEVHGLGVWNFWFS